MPTEAAELSRVIDGYVKAREASEIDPATSYSRRESNTRCEIISLRRLEQRSMLKCGSKCLMSNAEAAGSYVFGIGFGAMRFLHRSQL
jgi:hypothetical protein